MLILATNKKGNNMFIPTKQAVKDFFIGQKNFFVEVFKDYFRQLKYVVQLAQTVVLFLSVVAELPLQMLRCFATDAATYDAEQDEKFRTESKEGLRQEEEEKEKEK